MAGASAGLRRLSETLSINAPGSVMQSKGFYADQDFSRENARTVDRQGSIQAPPEFGLNSLKG
jgi:hypothetical protein